MGEVVHDPVSLPDQLREQPGKEGDPDAAAEQRSRACVEQILAHDRRTRITERFENAQLAALLFYHARHRRNADECCNEEEEKGKDKSRQSMENMLDGKILSDEESEKTVSDIMMDKEEKVPIPIDDKIDDEEFGFWG